MKANTLQIKRKLGSCLTLRQLVSVLLLALLLGTTGCGKKTKEVYPSCEDVATEYDALPVLSDAYSLHDVRRYPKCEYENRTCYYVESEKYLFFE